MFKKTNPLLMNELRLGVMCILAREEETDFVTLREATESTAGNLSASLSRLEEEGYIRIKKSFEGKRPITRCSITPKGKEALALHYRALKSYFNHPDDKNSTWQSDKE